MTTSLSGQVELVRRNLAHVLSPDEALVLLRAREVLSRLEAASKGGITITPVVSATTGEARLDITWQGIAQQLSVTEARELAHTLIEAASDAVGQAFLVSYLREVITLAEENVAQVLDNYRKFRDTVDQGRDAVDDALVVDIIEGYGRPN